MHQVRFPWQVFLTFALVAFLTSCGQSNPSTPPGAGRPLSHRASPATEPYSVALGCAHAWVGEWKPDGGPLYNEFKYDTDDQITSVAFDRSGDLYVGVYRASPLDSFVDEILPNGVKTRRIFTGIRYPAAMVTDPDGDLYVANVSFKVHDVVMYEPKSDSPDLRIDDFGGPADLAWAEGHLWVADYEKNEVKAYHVYPQPYGGSRAVLAWVINDDTHGPSWLSYVGGNLYVVNVPAVFWKDDYVREYNIDRHNRNSGGPIFARQIVSRLHYIKAVATDASEHVYLAEWSDWNTKWEVAVYNRSGQHVFSADDYREPVSIVTSETRWYAAQHTVGNHNRGAVEMFKLDHRLGELDLPPNCDHPSKLAIMQP